MRNSIVPESILRDSAGVGKYFAVLHISVYEILFLYIFHRSTLEKLVVTDR
jgi:hypothetical protein